MPPLFHPRPFEACFNKRRPIGIERLPSHHNCHCHSSTYPPSNAIGFPSDTHDTRTAQRYLPSSFRLLARRHGRAFVNALLPNNSSYAPSSFPLGPSRLPFMCPSMPCRSRYTISLICPSDAVAVLWTSTRPDSAAFRCRNEELHLVFRGLLRIAHSDSRRPGKRMPTGEGA